VLKHAEKELTKGQEPTVVGGPDYGSLL
jgi:hypothetical protein